MNIKRKFIAIATGITTLLIVTLLIVQFVFSSLEDLFSKNVNALNEANAYQEIYASGLQCGQALRNIYINQKDEKAKENFTKGIKDLEKSYEDFKKIKPESAEKIKNEYISFTTDLNKLNHEISSGTQVDENQIKSNTKIWREIKDKVTKNGKDSVKVAEEIQQKFINSLSKGTITAVATIIILIFIISIMLYVFANNITSSLSSIQQGLNSFFSFLNRETNKAELINLNSKDEFGEMAKVINENISSIEKEIALDNKLVDEAKQVITRVQHGWYSQHIESSTTNASLEEFKNGVNSMIIATKAHFAAMNLILEEYAAYDYTKELKLDNIEKGGVFEILVNDINKLRDAVTQMLGTSLQNGLELQGEASTLKQAVESLSTASNQQAASLEETAAAMEEMTSNVQNNVAKSNDMALMATQTDSAAREGAVLAQRTASAMTEIQSATNSINDAVAIIENIAFQTNILSLNAAVEAATAGDAGKGFAVVAQEVRNLANRSADAAKEIKAMASQAANKSNEGMNIATELTRGFEVIADKIAQTASMVQDVSNANREQMQGIGQINTAVTQLDQMTQENAKVAAQADSIANATISKAQAMVEDAQSKEFVGKNNIRATATRTNAPLSRTSKPVQAAKPVVVSKGKYASNAIAKNSSKHESDVWENF